MPKRGRRNSSEIRLNYHFIVVNNEIKYATPVDVVEEDGVYISRIRNDNSCKNTINMWITTG